MTDADGEGITMVVTESAVILGAGEFHGRLKNKINRP